MTAEPTITVIGAGMVGTCCALHLQNEGFAVTLLDRGDPGEGTSRGNLGAFGIASCPPLAMPGVLGKVPGMLLDAESPLKLRWGHALRALPWFLRFVANARRERVEAIAAARQSLLDRVHEGIDPLVAEAGAGHLMSRAGLMFTFESEAAFQGAAYAFDLRRRNGVWLDLLDGDEARQVQPALSKNVVRAYRVADFSHTVDPLRLVQALADLFRRRGGAVLRREVRGFEIGPKGRVRALRTGDGELPVERVVVAAGVWSRRLAALLGTKVPLEAERGYHVMFNGTDVKMNGGIISVDRSVAVTPMMDGIRAGGIAEIAAPEAAPDFANARPPLSEAPGPPRRSGGEGAQVPHPHQPLQHPPAMARRRPCEPRHCRCRSLWLAGGGRGGGGVADAAGAERRRLGAGATMRRRNPRSLAIGVPVGAKPGRGARCGRLWELVAPDAGIPTLA